jgi:hypothetical protein
MSTPLAPITWTGVAWQCSNDVPPLIPPPGVTTQGVWVMTGYKSWGKKKLVPTTWIWVPLPTGVPQVIPNNSGGSVIALFEGVVHPNTHAPWSPSYPRVQPLDLAVAGYPFVNAQGQGQVVNLPYVGAPGGSVIFTTANNARWTLPPVGMPSSPPPNGPAGGAWYGANAHAIQSAYYVYSTTAPTSGNLGLWLLLGGGVAAAGTAAAFM